MRREDKINIIARERLDLESEGLYDESELEAYKKELENIKYKKEGIEMKNYACSKCGSVDVFDDLSQLKPDARKDIVDAIFK